MANSFEGFGQSPQKTPEKGKVVSIDEVRTKRVQKNIEKEPSKDEELPGEVQKFIEATDSVRYFIDLHKGRGNEASFGLKLGKRIRKLNDYLRELDSAGPSKVKSYLLPGVGMWAEIEDKKPPLIAKIEGLAAKIGDYDLAEFVMKRKWEEAKKRLKELMEE